MPHPKSRQLSIIDSILSTMANESSPIISPPTLPSSVHSDPSDQLPTVRGRLPSQSSVRRMTTSSGASSTSQLASARYVRQFRALLEHQRELFDEERALWQIERSDLHDRILFLETSLRETQNGLSSQAISPSTRKESGSAFSFLSTPSGSRHVSSGDEFWRGTGGKGDTQPTRTFSATSEQSNGHAQRLASISEHLPPEGSGISRLTESIHRASIHKPSIPELKKSIIFDGINFRQPSHVPSISTEVITSQSPSPSRIATGTLRLSPVQLAPSTDYVTEHAGHTPLVHDLANGTDDTSSAVSNRTATPIEIQKENPPVDPRASCAKPPSERSDSYFAGILAETLEDPAMSGPLGLGDDNTSEDKNFLDQVDLKLKEAARQVQNGSTEESDILSDPPEHEPRLKIKRSMNFGSQLGGSKIF